MAVTLDKLTWERLLWWTLIGVILYFAYGYRHSILRSKPPEDSASGAPADSKA